MIPVFKPSITEEEIQAVTEVLKSGWLGLGPKTAEFEKKFADYVGSQFAVGVNSCTAALHLALNVLGIGQGDEVIVPTITFVSTAHAVVYNGAKPVFADVCEDTLCMDVEDVKRKVGKKTKVILPVHYGGHPCDMDKLSEIGLQKGIAVVEDAAHACGAEYKGKKIGSISELTCFSFHAVKNLTCGEGGMITTGNKVYDAKFRELRWLGISKDTWGRSEKEEVYAWQYWVNELGFKCHMHDISAAIGLVQLKRLEKLNQKRGDIVKKYNEGFKDLDWLDIPPEKDYVRSSWHIYHVKLDRRDKLISHLKNNDIAPGVHYYPNHLHPYYEAQAGHLPVAERIWKRILSLPLYPDMKNDEVDKVVEVVKDFDGGK